MNRFPLSQRSLFFSVSGLATARNVNQFLSVAELAIIAFDHNVEREHDKLVKAGAPSVLLRCLERALFQNERWDEVDPICKLLVLTYRCSDLQAAESITNIGGSLCPLLINILFVDEALPLGGAPQSLYQLIERLSTLEVNICKMDTSRQQLLRAFCEAVEHCDARADLHQLNHVVMLLNGLSRHVDTKTALMNHPLFGKVVSKFLASFVPGQKVNYEVARLLHSLAWSTRNKSKMVTNTDFIQLLLLLWRENDMATREEAIITAKLLSVETFGRSKLIVHDGKSFVDAISDSIQCAEIKVSCLEVLVHLICRETSLLICKHGSLIDVLTSIASDKSCEKSKLLAAQAIKRLASQALVNSKGNGKLLEAIISLLSSKDYRVRHWGIRAVFEQSQNAACNFYIMRTSHVVKILANLVMDENPSVKSTAVSVILKLASNPLNPRILGKNRVLLDALSCCAVEQSGQVCDTTRRNAIQTMLHLASHQKSKMIVAKHRNMVTSLSKYGVSQDNDAELKRAALHGVIWLAPHM